MNVLKNRTFRGSWLDSNKANAWALREIADWLEKNPQISLLHLVSHSEQDMYLFVVYYEDLTS